MKDQKNNEAIGGVIILVLVFAAGFFGYNWISPSEESQLRKCVSVMREAARRTSSFGELSAQLAEIENADTVTISRLHTRMYGADKVYTFDYIVDGRQRGIMCSM